MSRSIGADAFTSGRDIFFRQGAYQPTRPEGRSFLAHELTHVVQQGNRQISPFVQRGIFGKFKQAWKNRQDRAASREKIQEIEEKYGVKIGDQELDYLKSRPDTMERHLEGMQESWKPKTSWKDKLFKRNRLSDNQPPLEEQSQKLYEIYKERRKKLTSASKEWTSEELQNIEDVLQRFAPLLSEDRPEEWGPQPLLHLARFSHSIHSDEDERESDNTFVRGNAHIEMYDPAYNNPEFQDADQQFRAVLTKEIAMGLLTFIRQNSHSTMMVEFRNLMPYWSENLISQYARTKDGEPAKDKGDIDEDATRRAAADNGVEAPLTLSGMKDSYEDFANAVMFFFEDPARLQREGPERFQFVQEHVTPYLNEETVPEAAGVTTE
jgi:hypothetical protein